MKNIKKIVIIAMSLCVLIGISVNVSASEIVNNSSINIVKYEEFINDGDFGFNHGNERINYDGSFYFSGNQIVSTKFRLNSTSTTISATATTSGSKNDYTIELYQAIDNSSNPQGYQSVGKITYIANGNNYNYSFTGLSQDRFFILS